MNWQQWQGGTVVEVAGEGDNLVINGRIAAFIFETPDGFAWIEGSYTDPYGAASPAFHRRAGTWQRPGRLQTPDGATVEILPHDPEDPGDDAGPALAAFDGWLKAQGRTREEERARLAELLGDDLA